jgi:hypothetical protein
MDLVDLAPQSAPDSRRAETKRLGDRRDESAPATPAIHANARIKRDMKNCFVLFVRGRLAKFFFAPAKVTFNGHKSF